MPNVSLRNNVLGLPQHAIMRQCLSSWSRQVKNFSKQLPQWILYYQICTAATPTRDTISRKHLNCNNATLDNVRTISDIAKRVIVLASQHCNVVAKIVASTKYCTGLFVPKKAEVWHFLQFF